MLGLFTLFPPLMELPGELCFLCYTLGGAIAHKRMHEARINELKLNFLLFIILFSSITSIILLFILLFSF